VRALAVQQRVGNALGARALRLSHGGGRLGAPARREEDEGVTDGVCADERVAQLRVACEVEHHAQLELLEVGDKQQAAGRRRERGTRREHAQLHGAAVSAAADSSG
jgi:hypothetical protein